MTKELAFEKWVATLPKPVQQNMRDGAEYGVSYTREGFFAGWEARLPDEPSDVRVGAHDPSFEAMQIAQPYIDDAARYRESLQTIANSDPLSKPRGAFQEIARAALDRKES